MMKSKLVLILFFFNGFSLSVFSQYNGLKTENESVNIVLLGGQSNMAGKGIFTEVSASDLQRIEAVKNRVSVITDGREMQALSYFKDAKQVSEFGPELFVGITLAEKNPTQKYILIKEAVGGTTLYGAWSPDWTAEKAQAAELDDARQKMQLYSKHITSINKCFSELKSKAINYNIIGMLWMQGETDTRKDFTATAYEANLKRLIEAYRTELKIPTLPFVFGQINCPARGKYLDGVEIVRKGMLNVSETIANTSIIQTSMDSTYADYPKRSDNVHYTAEGQKRLGTVFANELMMLSGK